jgi:hypothetical protein
MRCVGVPGLIDNSCQNGRGGQTNARIRWPSSQYRPGCRDSPEISERLPEIGSRARYAMPHRLKSKLGVSQRVYAR